MSAIQTEISCSEGMPRTISIDNHGGRGFSCFWDWGKKKDVSAYSSNFCFKHPLYLQVLIAELKIWSTRGQDNTIMQVVVPRESQPNMSNSWAFFKNYDLNTILWKPAGISQLKVLRVSSWWAQNHNKIMQVGSQKPAFEGLLWTDISSSPTPCSKQVAQGLSSWGVNISSWRTVGLEVSSRRKKKMKGGWMNRMRIYIWQGN